MNGEIIEAYPSEQPNPRVLILGYDEKNIPIHVVVGVGDWNIQIVTSYYPSLEKWEADYKTRKVNLSPRLQSFGIQIRQLKAENCLIQLLNDYMFG